MVLVIKQNYRLEDLMFDQAVRLEKEGHAQEAGSKLRDALRADTLQKTSLKKIRSHVIRSAVAEDLELFRDDFDVLAEPYFNQPLSRYTETMDIQKGWTETYIWPHFGRRLPSRTQKKKNRAKHKALKLLKTSNRKKVEEEE